MKIRANIVFDEEKWHAFRVQCLRLNATASDVIRQMVYRWLAEPSLQDLCTDGHFNIVTRLNGERGILCRHCGALSWHPRDVERDYCGKCKEFFADMDRGHHAQRRALEEQR